MRRTDPVELKRIVVDKAHSLGANLARVAPVGRWEEHPVQDPGFWPQNIWPWARNVVVLGIPLFAPMVATTPSMVYQELYDTSNRVLDETAYRLTNHIMCELGYRAVWFPRDCYFGIDDLVVNPNAAFSHVVAAYYAGMGTIGASHNLLTRKFGPRVRMVSIVTDCPLEADPMLEEDLCTHCGLCLKKCPSQCFRDTGERVYEMDKVACSAHHVDLVAQHHWPCGTCIDVCPVGEDRRLYRGAPMLAPGGAEHCRAYGSDAGENADNPQR